MAIVRGNNLSQSIYGTSFNDSIYAYGGNDYINAGAGNDMVDGGTGNDTLTVEASLLRTDGRSDSVLRTVSGNIIKPGGVTAVTPDLFFASLSAPANRAPAAQFGGRAAPSY